MWPSRCRQSGVISGALRAHALSPTPLVDVLHDGSFPANTAGALDGDIRSRRAHSTFRFWCARVRKRFVRDRRQEKLINKRRAIF